MGLERKRATGARVNLTIMSGAISPEEILAYYGGMDEGDPLNAGDWITFDRDSDISELSLEVTAKLKAIVTRKVKALSAIQPIRSAIVSSRAINQPFFKFWRVLVATDPEHASDPNFFSSLEPAMTWLGIDASGRAEVAALLD